MANHEENKPGFFEYVDTHPRVLNMLSGALLYWAENLVRTDVEGIHRLQAAAWLVNSGERSLLVTSNHIGYLDAKPMGMVKDEIKAGIPFKIFLGNKYVGLNDDGSVNDDPKNRVVGKVATYASEHAEISLVPIAQAAPKTGEAMRQTMKAIIEARDESLGKGGVLGIFPEGTRSKNGELQLAQQGAVHALFRNSTETQTDTLILPMAIQGTDKVISLSPTAFRPFEKITVSFGRPYSYDDAIEEVKQYEDLHLSLADVCMLHISELLPREKWGVYREKFEQIKGATTLARNG